MYTPLPPSSEAFEQLSWSAIEPWYRELTATALEPATLLPWLTRWSRLSELVDETIFTNAKTASFPLNLWRWPQPVWN